MKKIYFRNIDLKADLRYNKNVRFLFFFVEGGYFFGYQNGRYSYNEKESSMWRQ
jgi:hypothetical protein